MSVGFLTLGNTGVELRFGRTREENASFPLVAPSEGVRCCKQESLPCRPADSQLRASPIGATSFCQAVLRTIAVGLNRPLGAKDRHALTPYCPDGLCERDRHSLADMVRQDAR